MGKIIKGVKTHMENLVKVENDRVAVSSRQIAENFEKQRERVSKALESIKA